jgi:hypothetical protein
MLPSRDIGILMENGGRRPHAHSGLINRLRRGG